MDGWTVGDVSRFLLEIGLEMHVGEFRTGQVDGPALLALDNPKMMDLGMYDMSARGYLRQCIKEHKEKPAMPARASVGSISVEGDAIPTCESATADADAVQTLMDLFPDISRDTIERVLAASGSTFDATTALCNIDVAVSEPRGADEATAQQKKKRVETVERVDNASELYFDVDPAESADVSEAGPAVEHAHSPTPAALTKPLECDGPLDTKRRGRRGSASALLQEMLDVLDDVDVNVDPDQEPPPPSDSPSVGSSPAGDDRKRPTAYVRVQELFPDLDKALVETEIDQKGEQQAISALMEAIASQTDADNSTEEQNTSSGGDENVVAADESSSEPPPSADPVTPSVGSAGSAVSPSKISSPAVRERSVHVSRDTMAMTRAKRHSNLAPTTADGSRRQSIASRPRLLSSLLDADKQRSHKTVGRGGDAASATLDKDEYKRREAITELAESEAMYQKDLHALHILIVAPMEKESVGAGASVDPELPLEAVEAMGRCVRALRESGTQFLAELSKVGTAFSGKETADVTCAWAAKLKERFISYCNTCYHLQQCFQRKAPAFEALIQGSSTDPLARGLPLSAFVLAPVQRVARYPLLLLAIANRHPPDSPEAELLRKVHNQYVDITVTCNNRLRSLESVDVVKQLEMELDRSQIESPVALTAVSLDGERRSLVKRATLDLVKLNDKGRVVKQRPMEFILFTDLLLYGKPLKAQREGDPTIQVYKEVHLTYIDCCAAKVGEGDIKSPDRRRKNRSVKGGMDITDELKLIFQVVAYYDDGKAEKLYMRAQSATDAKRWIEALNPSDSGLTWSKQRARATQDYEPRDKDELVLRVGDIIHIAETGDEGMLHGTRVQEIVKSKRKKVGWFSSSMVMMLPSLREDGNARKRLNSDPKMVY